MLETPSIRRYQAIGENLIGGDNQQERLVIYLLTKILRDHTPNTNLN